MGADHLRQPESYLTNFWLDEIYKQIIKIQKMANPEADSLEELRRQVKNTEKQAYRDLLKDAELRRLNNTEALTHEQRNIVHKNWTNQQTVHPMKDDLSLAPAHFACPPHDFQPSGSWSFKDIILCCFCFPCKTYTNQVNFCCCPPGKDIRICTRCGLKV